MQDPISADIAVLLHGGPIAGGDAPVVIAAIGGPASLAGAYAYGNPDAADRVAAMLLPVLEGDLLAVRAALLSGRIATNPGRTAAVVIGLPRPSRHPGGIAGWFTQIADAVLDESIPNAA